MALNTSPVRSDIGYLRRRVKPAAAAAAAAVAVTEQPVARQPEPQRPASGLSLGSSTAAPAAPSVSAATSSPASSGLSLGSTPREAAPSPSRQSAPAALLPFPAPAIDEVRELGDESPVLRLNRRESAIGSLIMTGVSCTVWEDDELVTGAGTPDGATTGSPVTTPGNRPLVGFDDSDAIVSLRHVGQLRRALFIGRGPEPIGVQIFDGSTVTVAPGDDERMFVLYALRIGGLLELRAEPVARSESDESIHRRFAFTLTPFLVTRASRSR